MKFRIQTEKYESTHTVDGVTAPITRVRKVAVPKLPRDVDAIAVQGVGGLVLVLTLISVTWSTVSIAHLLESTWTAYLAGAVFDLAWLAVLGMSFIVRYRPNRRLVVDCVGWALLAVTVTAILLEGLRVGGVAMAIVGSTVSIVAKTLWWTLNRAIRPTLSPEDAQWVEAETSRASAQLAVAAVRRQVARVEDQATVQLLALEASRRPPAGTELFGGVAEKTAPTAGLPPLDAVTAPTAPIRATVDLDEPQPSTPQEVPAPTPLRAVESQPQIAALEPLPAEVPAPLASGPVKEDPDEVRREAQREWIRREVNSGRSLSEPGFTKRAAEALGVSPRTIDSRKREVREEMEQAARELAG